MSITHAYIPTRDGTYEILHSREKNDKHVIDPSGPNYVNKHDYDVPPQIIEYAPYELPFIHEDSIEMFLPWTDEYKEKLAKYHGKESGSIHILKKEDEEREKTIKGMFNTEPPSYPYIESIPCINFNEGSLVLMWDKRKGKPTYDQRDGNSWFGPYMLRRSLIKKSTI
jgi:hypothetical protein